VGAERRIVIITSARPSLGLKVTVEEEPEFKEGRATKKRLSFTVALAWSLEFSDPG
jgi:hypothetical protein